MRLIAVASLSLFLVGCGSVFGGAPAPSAPIGMYSKAILDEAMSLHQLKLGLSAIELQPITMTMPTPVVVTPTTPPAVPPVIVSPVPGIPGSFPSSPPVTPRKRSSRRHILV